jgi:hypothetical protein
VAICNGYFFGEEETFFPLLSFLFASHGYMVARSGKSHEWPPFMEIGVAN